MPLGADLASWERTVIRSRWAPPILQHIFGYINKSLRFYRIHLLLFTIVPLVAAAIFWASNGEFKICFTDALFVCISAATGTGLSPVDLSSTTPWQQVIIVLLEICGNIVFVSWVVVYFRRAYFIDHLKHIVLAERERKMARHETNASHASQGNPSRAIVDNLVSHGLNELRERQSTKVTPTQRRTSNRSSANNPPTIRTDMVRRLDVAPCPIDPTGNTSLGSYASGVHIAVLSPQRTADGERLQRVRSMDSRAYTYTSAQAIPPQHAHPESFGGFPYPWRLLSGALRRLFPTLHRNLRRTMTMPQTSTLLPPNSDVAGIGPGDEARRVPYISFSAIVGRNSTFHDLTDENIEELGGVEYRALTALLWIVPLYYFGLLAITFIIIAPYANLARWRWIFLIPEQHRDINPLWFSAFQVVGAWANTGMSLVDQNMVPFREAYPMIIFLVLDVLAGNTAFPIFLRFLIWVLTKLLNLFNRNSRTAEALHFLLDHPRRCFIYLFPANQTWALLVVQFAIDLVLWFFNIVLDLGNPATESIPIGTRLVDALLQAAAVRSAGFQAISLSTLVPAVQVLDVIMMYVAIYPIALSVRSTNVYEETSLGIYEQAEEMYGLDDSSESRVGIWGRYLWKHARRQLSFDMWWLVLSLFLICIIERTPLMDTSKASWFNIFAIIFELVSGYGTVGLSLGVPYANYSFCGALHTLSKLILCAVMIRGRHRGLPVALDRAVLLPHEFEKREDGADEAHDPPAQEPNMMSEKRQQTDAASMAPEKDGMIEGSSTSKPVSPRTRTLSFADQPALGLRLVDFHVDNMGSDTLPSRIHDIDETSPI